MKPIQFILLILAIFIGALAALAVAALYARNAISTATAGNSTLTAIENLL